MSNFNMYKDSVEAVNFTEFYKEAKLFGYNPKTYEWCKGDKINIHTYIRPNWTVSSNTDVETVIQMVRDYFFQGNPTASLDFCVGCVLTTLNRFELISMKEREDKTKLIFLAHGATNVVIEFR